MKKVFVLLFLLFLLHASQAQYKVQFILKEKTAIKHDSIFIVGTFSNWDSTPNIKFLLRPYGQNEKSITLDLKGPIRYKFHRGSWRTVEKLFNGNEVDDRVLTITKDTVLKDSVSTWRDEIIADRMLQLQQERSDTNRLVILSAVANAYAFAPEYFNPDSALFYAQTALQLHQKIASSEDFQSGKQSGNPEQLFELQEILAELLHSLGNYPKSLEIRFENLSIVEKSGNKRFQLYALRNIADDYLAMKDYQNVLKYARLEDSVLSTISAKDNYISQENYFANDFKANAYYNLAELDSALLYALKNKDTVSLNTSFQIGKDAFNNQLIANIFLSKKKYDTAFFHFRKAIEFGAKAGAQQVVAISLAGIARVFRAEGNVDSALYYARAAMHHLKSNTLSIKAWGQNIESFMAEISPLLAGLYLANHQPDSAYKYLQLSITLKDSLFNADKVRQFQTLSFNESARRQQLEQQSKEARQQFATRIKIYGLITVIAAILALAFVLYRNNKQKQKANLVLNGQKQELESTLKELKVTQAQLVQSEKMASLGELTAGIAHEIQNPLNFVNNFSEINKELLAEMKDEIAKGHLEEVTAIANDIIDNQEKINHHGRRADSIVKGMLQHSRKSGGEKEPTDINALADEYLRLAYHGLRAKEKDFNATLKTDFDKSIGKINVLPQDLGRVILNLVNNAFFAVQHKQKHISNGLSTLEKMSTAYEPTVELKTKQLDNKILITVKDNGNGIPQNIVDKIFQPFFTTKPTGQGTGLGLSMSYDIVKAHGGEISVNTILGQGSEFVIQLPAN